MSESCCINTRVGCQPPAAETRRVPICLSLSLSPAISLSLLSSRSSVLSLSFPPPVSLSLSVLSVSPSLVGWPWVAGSYATGIDIPGGQTVNSRLVRTESVVGLHNMVVPLFHPPLPPTPPAPPPPPPPPTSARIRKEGRYRRAENDGRRVTSCKVVATRTGINERCAPMPPGERGIRRCVMSQFNFAATRRFRDHRPPSRRGGGARMSGRRLARLRASALSTPRR